MNKLSLKIFKSILLGVIAYMPMALIFAKDSNSYLCVAEKATGFSYSSGSKSWTSTNFKVSETKYLLLKTSNKWEWRDFGSNFGGLCEAADDGDFIKCNVLFGEHIMSRKNLRFMKSYMVGYVDGVNSDSNTPSIIIGKCSPF